MGHTKADVGHVLDLARSQLERRIHRIPGLPGTGGKGNMGGKEGELVLLSDSMIHTIRTAKTQQAAGRWSVLRDK